MQKECVKQGYFTKDEKEVSMHEKPVKTKSGKYTYSQTMVHN